MEILNYKLIPSMHCHLLACKISMPSQNL